MASFDFSTANRIIFGLGSVKQAGKVVSDLIEEKAVLVVTGKKAEYIPPLMDSLEKIGLQVILFRIPGEPSVDMILDGISIVEQSKCTAVIGCGGGSALDAGKAIAALSTNPGDIFDYLEVVGKGQPLTNASLPFVAIPTTAGTGTEVTRNAVISVPDRKLKVSLRGSFLIPKVAIVDPELTYGLPPAVTASTGLDALTQLIEPFVSNKANPMSDAICREGLKRAGRSLRNAYDEGNNAQAREDMCVSSLFGGMALANAKLGAAHGFASPIGGRYPAPHGAICARILPVVMEVNVRALKNRQPGDNALVRYDEISQLLTGNSKAVASDGVRWVHDLVDYMKVPFLKDFGLQRNEFDDLCGDASRASSMQGNPIKLTFDELKEILELAYEK